MKTYRLTIPAILLVVVFVIAAFLPDATVLCPGHGPLTTVGEEKSHNPFFAP